MTAIVAIAATNLRRMLREPSSLFFVFIFPMALIFLIGASFGGGSARTLVVWTDGTDLAADVVATLRDVPNVEVSTVDAAEDVRETVTQGRASAGLVVRGADGGIEYLARPEGAGPVLRQVVDAAVAQVSTRARALDLAGDDPALVDRTLAVVPPVEVVDRRLAGDATGLSSLGRFDLGAAQQLFLFVFVTSLSGSAALILSRQLGVTRRMLAAPVTSLEVVAGEALGRFAIALVQGGYIVAGTALVYDVEWGDPVVTVVVLVLFCALSAGAAMLLGATLENDQQASGVGVMAGLGLAALGGCMVPLDVMSATMQRIAHVTPHAWALDAVAETVRFEAGLGDVLLEVAVLAAAALLALGLSAWSLHRTVVRSA